MRFKRVKLLLLSISILCFVGSAFAQKTIAASPIGAIHTKCDTVYNGKLVWHLNCDLDSIYNRKTLDSIATILRKNDFDRCVIECTVYITPDASMACGLYKSEQIKVELRKRGVEQNKISAAGKKIIMEERRVTKVIITRCF
jgi:hypothetical protein